MPANPHDAGDATSLWHRLMHLFRRSSATTCPEVRLIRVWDAARGVYRAVDLNNRNDSLWSAANELAHVQASHSSSSAA